MGERGCTVAGCDSLAAYAGMCGSHYKQAWRRGERQRQRRGVCSIEGCDRPHTGRGWCSVHWQRWRTHGDPLSDVPVKVRATPPRNEAALRTVDVDIARLAATDPLPGWDRFGNCRGLDGDSFYPTRGESTREAKQVCAGCQVRYACLAAGLREKFGVWGGLSERQRRRVASQLREHRRSAA